MRRKCLGHHWTLGVCFRNTGYCCCCCCLVLSGAGEGRTSNKAVFWEGGASGLPDMFLESNFRRAPRPGTARGILQCGPEGRSASPDPSSNADIPQEG